MTPRPPAGRAARRRARRAAPPLPQRDGLDAVRYIHPRHAEPVPVIHALLARFPALADPAATPLGLRADRGEILRADGTAWGRLDEIGPGQEAWFHRELGEETVPGTDLVILHWDEHLLVLDKPHDMATMPRGAHVLASALVRLRRQTGITTLSPLHRLDRRTAGVLAFGVRPEERSAYQDLFARREVRKEYLARVLPPSSEGAARGSGEPPTAPGELPTAVGERAVLRDRLVKRRGDLLARIVHGEDEGGADAVTEVEVVAAGADGTLTLRLSPVTGRTHQLRAQLAARGAPILGEDLYPAPREPDGPLQLLARALAFTDPVTGQERHFTTRRALADPGEGH